LLKAFHLQGATVLLTLEFLLFSLVFMPAMICSQLKDKKNEYSKQSIKKKSIFDLSFLLITFTLQLKK